MKSLSALHISRDEDGSHRVIHHFLEHPPATHRFKRRSDAIAHILQNVQRLEPGEGPPQMEEEEDSEPYSEPEGRSASFDSGSTRLGEIAGRKR